MRPISRPRRDAFEATAEWSETAEDEWLNGSPNPRFVPRVDVSDDRTHVRVSVELPGLSEKDIEVEVQDEILIVRGDKKLDVHETTARFYRVERTHGHFERTIILPTEVGSGGAEANFRQGLLTIRLPKMRTSAPPRPIPVRAK